VRSICLCVVDEVRVNTGKTREVTINNWGRKPDSQILKIKPGWNREATERTKELRGKEDMENGLRPPMRGILVKATFGERWGF